MNMGKNLGISRIIDSGNGMFGGDECAKIGMVTVRFHVIICISDVRSNL